MQNGQDTKIRQRQILSPHFSYISETLILPPTCYEVQQVELQHKSPSLTTPPPWYKYTRKNRSEMGNRTRVKLSTSLVMLRRVHGTARFLQTKIDFVHFTQKQRTWSCLRDRSGRGG